MAPRFVLLQRGAALGLVALGFAALAVAGELSPASLLACAGAMVASVLPRWPRLPPRVWLTLQVGFLVWMGVGWAVLGRHVLTVFAELLIFVQLHRILTRKSARDDLYSAFIAFGQLLLSSVLTIDVAWFVIFLFFVLLLTWSLLLTRLGLVVEGDHALVAPGRPVPPERWRRLDRLLRWPFFAAVGGLNALLLIATLLLFFLLPRMQLSFLGGSLLPPVHVTGFDERVRLGEVGLVQLSDEPVLRVTATGREGQPIPANDLYWAGLALDRFDGDGWSVSDATRIPLLKVGVRPQGPPSQPWTHKLEVTREPLDSEVLFVVPRAVGLYGDFRQLEAADTEGLYLPDTPGRVSYTVYSAPALPDPDALRAEDGGAEPPALLARYTQLPPDVTPAVGQLAEAWAGGAASRVDAALLIAQRFRTDFTYTLDQPSAAYEDPVEAFLTEVQEGHCEYFATAMTLMLRSRGVPARVVNGFNGGEFNPIGEYWIVRQRDAHSWVEVHFPETGWVVFDPTPTATGGLAASARQNLMATIGAWTDYGRVVWSDLLLDYGLESQWAGVRKGLAALSTAGEAFGGGADLGDVLSTLQGREPAERARGRLDGRWFVAGALLVVGAAFAAARPRRRRGIERLLAHWARAAERLGDDDAPGAGGTALQWARWAARTEPERFADAPEAIEAWYATRFGGAEASAELQRSLSGLGRRAARWRPRR
jgi:transglutaminase-like putative cysteine protease